MAWYAVHTISGQEEVAKRELLRRIKELGKEEFFGEIFIPKKKVVVVRKKKSITKEQPLYPGYMFIKMVLNRETKYIVETTPKIIRFVGEKERPAPVSESEIEKIKKSMEEMEPEERITLRRGDTVRIVEGPFEDYTGVVEEVDREKGKVTVLISIFDRQMPVQFNISEVEKS